MQRCHYLLLLNFVFIAVKTDWLTKDQRGREGVRDGAVAPGGHLQGRHFESLKI